MRAGLAQRVFDSQLADETCTRPHPVENRQHFSTIPPPENILTQLSHTPLLAGNYPTPTRYVPINAALAFNEKARNNRFFAPPNSFCPKLAAVFNTLSIVFCHQKTPPHI